MNDAPDAEQEPSQYLRLPLPVVAGGIVVLLAALLAFGVYANNNLRPGSGAAPTPVAQPAAPSPTSAPPVVATPTPVVATPTLAPTPLVLTSPASPTPAPPPATAVAPTPSTPSARPTLDPLLTAEVSQAFDQYWRVRSQALLDLDKTHLSDVMGGAHLQVIAARIDVLRSENRAIKTDVDHDITIIDAGRTMAQVVDDYISNSVYVDPSSHEPLSDPASDELRVLYKMDKSDGVWKVVDSVQAD